MSGAHSPREPWTTTLCYIGILCLWSRQHTHGLRVSRVTRVPGSNTASQWGADGLLCYTTGMHMVFVESGVCVSQITKIPLWKCPSGDPEAGVKAEPNDVMLLHHPSDVTLEINSPLSWEFKLIPHLRKKQNLVDSNTKINHIKDVFLSLPWHT